MASGVAAGVRAMLRDWQTAAQAPNLPSLSSRTATVLEVSTLTVALLIITYPIHTGYLAPDLPGKEHQRLSGVILPVRDELQRGQLAMWNPYLLRGEPLTSNPFNYLWNPVASVPVLALGPSLGTRWAVALHILAAGLGAWLWARSARLGWLPRLYCGAIYAFSGGMISRFAVGHFQLGLSLAWVPWTLAGLQFALRDDIRANTRAFRLSIILMATGFALTFLSGNIFYTLPLGVCLAIIGSAHLVKRNGGQLQFDSKTAAVLIVGAGIAVGLSAVLFIPVWAHRDFITGHPDGTNYGSQTMAEGFANYLITDKLAFFYQLLPPFDAGNYAYMGLIPVGLLALAPAAALTVADRRKLVFLMTGLLLLMLAWAGKAHTIVGELYNLIPILGQWRFVARFLAIGNVAIAFLGAVGLQFFVDRFDPFRRTLAGPEPVQSNLIRNIAVTVGLAALIVSAVLSEVTYNLKLLVEGESTPQTDLSMAARWLASQPQPAYVAVDLPFERDTFTIYLNHIRQVSLDEGWRPSHLPDDISTDIIPTDHHYWILKNKDSYLYDPLRTLLMLPNGAVVIGAAGSVPFAYMVGAKDLSDKKIHVDQLDSLTPVELSANHYTFEVNSMTAGTYLIVNSLAYPGWSVEVDGRPDRLTVINGSLAVQLLEGQHTVTFRYIDTEFIIGLAVSLVTMLACVVWLRWPDHKSHPNPSS